MNTGVAGVSVIQLQMQHHGFIQSLERLEVFHLGGVDLKERIEMPANDALAPDSRCGSAPPHIGFPGPGFFDAERFVPALRTELH